MKNYPILINGSLVDSSEKIIINSPINNMPYATVPYINEENIVNAAMSAAHLSFKNWSITTFEFRKNLLLKFKELVLANIDELSQILVNEISKSYNDSKTEIIRTMEYLDETIFQYEKLQNNPMIIDENIHKIKGKTGKFIREPLGVVLAISPFNYPFNLLLAKLVPALISGNTVVYKPATQGSIIGARISQLFNDAGFPNGVINCVVGKGSKIGDLLISHKYVNMISFTGSARVGNHISDVCHKIPLVLEMGGKDPAIILDDADLELAANEIVKGGLSYNGQRCTAIKRVFVTPKNHAKLVELVVNKVQSLTIGNPFDNNFITPLISNSSANYVMELVNDAISKGAKTCLEIKREENLLWPMIIDNVTIDMKLAWEEPFGPVIPFIEFNTIEEVIEYSNNSEYGLQASIFTNNIELAESIALKLECGTVNINRSSSRGPDIFPFSGVKNSGFGTQGILDAILSMTKIKGIIFNK